MSDTLIFNGKSFAEFNTFFDGSKAFGSPEKDYELVEVPGRNGSLSIYNNRFKDIELSFPCFIRTNFIQNYRKLTEYLNSQQGYQKLTTSKEPDHYRMALFRGIVEPQTTPFNQGGFFTLTFTVKPQRYLVTGETPVSADSESVLINPTLFDSKPLIRCYGTGMIQINGDSIIIAENPYEYIDIDCELMDAKSGLNNANSYVTFSTTGYITLKSGANGIEHNLTNVQITPRWFEI